MSGWCWLWIRSELTLRHPAHGLPVRRQLRRSCSAERASCRHPHPPPPSWLQAAEGRPAPPASSIHAQGRILSFFLQAAGGSHVGDGRRGAAPVSGGQFGGSLHAWPSRQRTTAGRHAPRVAACLQLIEGWGATLVLSTAVLLACTDVCSSPSLLMLLPAGQAPESAGGCGGERPAACLADHVCTGMSSSCRHERQLRSRRLCTCAVASHPCRRLQHTSRARTAFPTSPTLLMLVPEPTAMSDP